MAPKDPASPGGASPLRVAVGDAYERASGLAAYFGQLTRDLATGRDRVPDAAALAEAEAMIAALGALVHELPRLVPGFAERTKSASDENSEAAG